MLESKKFQVIHRTHGNFESVSCWVEHCFGNSVFILDHIFWDSEGDCELTDDLKLNLPILPQIKYIVLWITVYCRRTSLKHLILIVMKPAERVLEIFDSIGMNMSISSFSHSKLIQSILFYLPKGWKYVNCCDPNLAIQLQQRNTENTAFCISYCLLFLHLRVMFPNVNLCCIHKTMCHMCPYQIERIIRVYTGAVEIVCEKWWRRWLYDSYSISDAFERWMSKYTKYAFLLCFWSYCLIAAFLLQIVLYILG